MGRNFLGEFEQVVLLALARCARDAYSVTVHEEILSRTGRDVSIPAVYVTLDRLESKGLARSRMGEPTPEPGGRAKRYFEVTDEGREALEEARSVLESLWEGLELAEEG